MLFTNLIPVLIMGIYCDGSYDGKKLFTAAERSASVRQGIVVVTESASPSLLSISKSASSLNTEILAL